MMSTATATRPKIVEPIQKAPGMTVVFREVIASITVILLEEE
jgi:hypothetical protein